MLDYLRNTTLWNKSTEICLSFEKSISTDCSSYTVSLQLMSQIAVFISDFLTNAIFLRLMALVSNLNTDFNFINRCRA